MLTRAVLAIASEAAETEAGVAADGVHTLGKLTALVGSCLTFIYI